MDLIVFYSRTNNTKEVAELIAEEKNADLLEIKDEKSRSGALGYVIGAIDSFRDKKTRINYEEKDLSKYDTIYIGTPVWASKPTPAILQFINENDFSGKNVVTFATFMGSGDEATITALNNSIKNKGGNINRSFAFKMTGTDKKTLVNKALNEN